MVCDENAKLRTEDVSRPSVSSLVVRSCEFEDDTSADLASTQLEDGVDPLGLAGVRCGGDFAGGVAAGVAVERLRVLAGTDARPADGQVLECGVEQGRREVPQGRPLRFGLCFTQRVSPWGAAPPAL